MAWEDLFHYIIKNNVTVWLKLVYIFIDIYLSLIHLFRIIYSWRTIIFLLFFFGGHCWTVILVISTNVLSFACVVSLCYLIMCFLFYILTEFLFVYHPIIVFTISTVTSLLFYIFSCSVSTIKFSPNAVNFVLREFIPNYVIQVLLSD